MEPLTDERLKRLEACMAILAVDSAAAWKMSSSGCVDGWRFEREVIPGVQAWSTAMPGTSLRKFMACGVLLGVTPDAVAHMLIDAPTRLSWDTSYSGIDTIVPAYASPSLLQGDIVNLCRLMIAPILIISARDFLNLQFNRVVKEDGTWQGPLGAGATPSAQSSPAFRPHASASVSYCIDDARCPPASGYVRGDVHPGSAWLVTPLYAEDAQDDDVRAAVKEGRWPRGMAPQGGGAVPTHAATLAGRPIIGTRMVYAIFTDIKGWIPHAVVNTAVTDSFGKYYSQLRAWFADKGVGL